MASTSDSPDDGLEPLRAVLRANPRSAVFVALAHRLCDAGRAVEAEEVCRDGLEHHPDLVTGRVALGRALFVRGRLREAQQVLIEGARAQEDNGDVFRWLGEVLVKRGDLPRARSVLEYAEVLCGGDQRVAELLVEAGGAPSFRPSRPSSDFEHTKVSNSRALAQQMQDAPEPTARPRSPRPAAAPPVAKPPGAALGAFEPTVIDAAPMGATAPKPVAAVVARSGAWVAWARRRRGVTAGLGVAAVAIVVVLVAASRGGGAPAPDAATRALHERANAALASGGIDDLSSIRRDLSGAGSATLLADAAMVDAVLAVDHGAPFAEELLELPATAAAPDRARHGVARGLLALARGKLDPAATSAKTALEIDPASADARLLLARVELATGQLDAAARSLERVLAASTSSSHPSAVVTWSVLLAEQGKLADAEASLRTLVAKRSDLLVARATHARLERMLGRPAVTLDRAACAAQGARAALVAAWCHLDAAEADRLEGKRTSAVKAARAAVDLAPHDGRVLVAATLALVDLGEVDAAANALDKARQVTGGALPSLGWADRAVALARRQPPPEGHPGPPSSLDAAHTSLRFAYAKGGAGALGLAARDVASAAVVDPDLRALSLLAKESRPGPSVVQELAEKADGGNPVAAFVAGKIARHTGDLRLASKRLEKALTAHADGCLAAVDYASVLRLQGRAAGPSAPAFAPLRKHNARCKWD